MIQLMDEQLSKMCDGLTSLPVHYGDIDVEITLQCPNHHNLYSLVCFSDGFNLSRLGHVVVVFSIFSGMLRLLNEEIELSNY